MTDEQVWLLRYGRGWIPWYELLDGSVGEQEVDPLHTRLTEAGKMEINQNTMCVRLKQKEENEPIRI
jgi:hypothetical protein